LSSIGVAAVIAANLGLLFFLLAAPLGERTVTVRRRVRADRGRVWNALFPLGTDRGWSGEILSAETAADPALVRVALSWEGRDGRPIERMLKLEAVEEGSSFSQSIVEDSSLDPSFWKSYRETSRLTDVPGGVDVQITRTDRYRGAAFLIFRYFALRRQAAKLKVWAETGRYRAGGLYEHPASQLGFALLSIVLLWPLFGLTVGGLIMASVLTMVVGLHELGHLAAFRLMGHRRVRMIFIPLLGGIAIGGRPYDSRFEVAFVALMGAGFSAFFVPVAIAASIGAQASGHPGFATLFGAVAGCSALFNIANLVPVWKFDGGQVLRQICGSQGVLALASFLLLSAFLAVGHVIGLDWRMLLVGGVVFALLSLVTGSNAVKPRHDLKPIATMERLAIGAALVAIFAIHAYGIIWASARMA
jgi:Zn-dependent protease